MVADRKVALLNSNNIQDRVNVEMMIHVGEPGVILNRSCAEPTRGPDRAGLLRHGAHLLVEANETIASPRGPPAGVSRSTSEGGLRLRDGPSCACR
jgi:hypothetical protein